MAKGEYLRVPLTLRLRGLAAAERRLADAIALAAHHGAPMSADTLAAAVRDVRAAIGGELLCALRMHNAQEGAMRELALFAGAGGGILEEGSE